MSSSSRTVILLNFNEREGVAPSDAARGLGDLGGDPSSTPALGEPTVVQGRFGNARSFDGTQGLVGTELTADQTKLRRTMAIEAIVTLDQAKASDGTRTILARGKLGGTGADRHLYALTVRTSAGKTYLELTWNNLSGGVIEFVAPPGWVYLAAVRRWISESEVEVEMFVNGVSIGVDTSADGAITDGDGGKVTVGCFASASGDPYQFFWEDAIDAIRVTRGEKTAEEIRHTYDRLFLFPQWGYELVKAFLPPGQAFSPNPDSVVQRELMIEGDALGEAWAHLEELRRYALPDQAWRTLDRWESILRLQPGPRETFAQRRLRVLGHIRRIHGFSVGEIVNAVAELLAVNADQLEVLENSNLVVDTWASGVGNRWYTYAGNGSVTGTSPGVDLVLTSGQSHDWTHLVQDAPHLRMPVVSDAKVEIIGKLDIPDTILQKPGPLTDHERAVMQTHTTLGHERLLALEDSDAIDLELVRHHHERLDGTGYPDRLLGPKIPLSAKYFAVIDTFDAMTSYRPYRDAVGPKAAELALRELNDKRDAWYCAEAVEMFEGLYRSGRLAWVLEYFNDSCPVPPMDIASLFTDTRPASAAIRAISRHTLNPWPRVRRV